MDPKKNKGFRVRRRRVAITLSPKAYKLLERLAAEKGLRPTSYVAALVRVDLRDYESGDLLKG